MKHATFFGLFSISSFCSQFVLKTICGENRLLSHRVFVFRDLSGENSREN